MKGRIFFMEKIMKQKFAKQVKQFIENICINTWQMSQDEVEAYCKMIVKQNIAMAQWNKDYLQTAVAFAPFAGFTAKEVKKQLPKEVNYENKDKIH